MPKDVLENATFLIDTSIRYNSNLGNNDAFNVTGSDLADSLISGFKWNTRGNGYEWPYHKTIQDSRGNDRVVPVLFYKLNSPLDTDKYFEALIKLDQYDGTDFANAPGLSQAEYADYADQLGDYYDSSAMPAWEKMWDQIFKRTEEIIDVQFVNVDNFDPADINEFAVEGASYEIDQFKSDRNNTLPLANLNGDEIKTILTTIPIIQINFYSKPSNVLGFAWYPYSSGSNSEGIAMQKYVMGSTVWINVNGQALMGLLQKQIVTVEQMDGI